MDTCRWCVHDKRLSTKGGIWLPHLSSFSKLFTETYSSYLSKKNCNWSWSRTHSWTFLWNNSVTFWTIVNPNAVFLQVCITSTNGKFNKLKKKFSTFGQPLTFLKTGTICPFYLRMFNIEYKKNMTEILFISDYIQGCDEKITNSSFLVVCTWPWIQGQTYRRHPISRLKRRRGMCCDKYVPVVNLCSLWAGLGRRWRKRGRNEWKGRDMRKWMWGMNRCGFKRFDGCWTL